MMSRPNRTTNETGRGHNFNRPGMYKILATLGVSALFGSALQANKPAEANATTPRQAVANTARSFAAQAIRDFRTAPRREKQSALGLKGVEAFLLQYPVKDHIKSEPAKYSIEASITRDSHGNLSPRNLNSILIKEDVGTDEIYSFQIAKTNNQWEVSLSESQSSTSPYPAHYSYTTGTPFPQESLFPLTTSEFGSLAQGAQTVLNDAKNRSPLTQPPVPPFPPPHYVPAS